MASRFMTRITLFFFALGMASSAHATTMINGAGATFPYPLYSKWFSEFKKVDGDTQVNYNSIGSGGGIKQFTDKTVDFGASDAPMTDEQVAKVEGGVIHIPTALGAVVLSYNLKDIQKPIRLTPELIADIFLGKVTKWNDEKIKKENPGVAFPDLAIVPVHRADGSGTTAIFTDYLSKVSSQWKSEAGQGTAVKWSGGLGGKGNEGVTGQILQTPGAIGYIEFIYAETNKMPKALVKNKSGSYVAPSVKAITAAAASVKNMPADFRVSITDAMGKDAYPISGFTYILVRPQLPKDKGQKLLSLLNWIVGPAQSMTQSLNYAPLPASLQAKVKATIKKIEVK